MTTLDIPVFDVRGLEPVYPVITSSKGNQPKWRVDDNWIKQDFLGYEGVAEVLASNILECTTLPPNAYTIYRPCKIITETGEHSGCYCKDFRGNLSEKSLGRLLELYNIDFIGDTKGLSLEDSFSYLLTIIQAMTGITKDVSDAYLRVLFAFDALTLNEDRHLNNILFLTDGFSFPFSPIYDNGLAFLSDVRAYPYQTSLSVLERKVKPVLLTRSFTKHASLYKSVPFIDKQKLINFLNQYEDYYARAGSLLRRRLNSKEYGHLFF